MGARLPLWSVVLALALTLGVGALAQEAHRTCETCHQTHGGTQKFALLKGNSADGLCLGCHGTAAPPPRPEDAASARRASKLLSEPRAARSEHLWAEAGRWRQPKRDGQGNFFAGACLQCHESHAAEWKGTGPARTLTGPAYSPEGRRVGESVTRVADVCFRCHGQETWGGSDPLKVGDRFSAGAASSHRLGSRGRADLPSLRGVGERVPLDCTSCHGYEEGLRGPHVSPFPALLKEAYLPDSGTAESDAAYALCYSCHDRNSVLGNESFRLHRQHITGQWAGGYLPGPPRGFPGAYPPSGVRPTVPRPPSPPRAGSALAGGMARPASCAACHDPHGSRDARALVAFSEMDVTANSQGMRRYLSAGPGSGSCSLSCHGHDHVDAPY